MSITLPTSREIEDYQRTRPGARDSELMDRVPGETKTFHSNYMGHRIYKVVQDNGRTSYDIYEPNGNHWTESTLKIARASVKFS